MRGVNKVILVGTLGADPEVRYMPSGGAVASIRVATNEAWKDKATGQLRERTEWHSVTLYNRLGEIAGEYLRKGAQVYIEGSLRTEKWQDKNGQDRYTTKIVAAEMQMLGGGRSGGSGGADRASGGAYGRGKPSVSQAPSPAASGGSKPAGAAGFDDFDDDIPFAPFLAGSAAYLV